MGEDRHMTEYRGTVSLVLEHNVNIHNLVRYYGNVLTNIQHDINIHHLVLR